MRIESAKAKGKRFEDWIAQQIEDAGLGRARREKGSGSGKYKGDIFANIDFLLECKNEKQTNFLTNIDQAKRQAEIGNWAKEKWCLIARDPRFPEFQEVYATINLGEFLKLLKTQREPIIKQPDRSMKWKLEKLRQIAKEIIKDLE